MIDKTIKKSTLTTIGIDQHTNKLIDKLCKRYSLKKGEIVKLAFIYLDKACINPAEAPESTKTELSKINKRQDDIIRFIRNYEEKELNPMIRATNSIAVRFDGIGKDIVTTINKHLEQADNQNKKFVETLNTNFKKIDEAISKHASVINLLSKRQILQEKKQIKLLSLYEELSNCGITEGKKKEQLREQIKTLVESNNQQTE